MRSPPDAPSTTFDNNSFLRESDPAHRGLLRAGKGVCELWSVSLTLRVEVRLLRGIQAIVVRNDVSRQLGEVFLPVARKTYIPDDPSTLFDFELGDEHRLRDPAGHRVRSRPNEEIATNCQRDAASNLNRSSAIPDGYL